MINRTRNQNDIVKNFLIENEENKIVAEHPFYGLTTLFNTPPVNTYTPKKIKKEQINVRYSQAGKAKKEIANWIAGILTSNKHILSFRWNIADNFYTIETVEAFNQKELTETESNSLKQIILLILKLYSTVEEVFIKPGFAEVQVVYKKL